VSESDSSSTRAPEGPSPLLRVDDLRTHFPVTRGLWGRTVGHVKAVDGVSLELFSGETLGVVGESGCGKTTLGRSILRLIEPTSGGVHFGGKEVTRLNRNELRELRRDMQIIFQDPFSSLNPRMRIIDIIGEPLLIHKLARPNELEVKGAALLDRVGLPRSALHRYPHEFSGGQRQRIGVARAIALQPKLIICDEAVSALDVSIQAQILNLLIELQREMHLSYLFIAHDLSVIKHISSRIAVMYLGRIVETGSTEDLFTHPSHPYTEALLSAIPRPIPGRKRDRQLLTGDVPSPMDPPTGCRFHTRCPAVFDRCDQEQPQLFQLSLAHRSACFHAESVPSDAADAHREARRRIHEQIAARRADAKVDASAPALEELEPAREQQRIVAPSLSRFRRPVSVASALLGALLLLWGHGVLAWCALLGLYFGSVRERWPGKWARRSGLVGTLLICVALGFVTSSAWKVRDAKQQLDALRTEIAAFTDNRGRLPHRLSELGWRLHRSFRSGQPLDPWNQPWQYQVDAERGTFSLVSLGRDGRLGGDDVAALHVDPSGESSD